MKGLGLQDPFPMVESEAVVDSHSHWEPHVVVQHSAGERPTFHHRAAYRR
jgi:hypothetical protein